jgi:beta-lactamase class A
LLIVAAVAAVTGAVERSRAAGGHHPQVRPAPSTLAIGNVRVWQGAQAPGRFRVSSMAAAGTASATLVIRSASGATVKTIALGRVRPGRVVTRRFLATLPAGTYSYRVLASLGGGASPGPAKPATLVVRQTFPGPAAIAAATTWLRERAGVTAYAVIDSRGRLYGHEADEQFVTASVAKAMLLVAYLRTFSSLDSYATATLTSMIELSDNNAAFAMYRLLGSQGMYGVAQAAGMRHFWVSRDWTYAETTAADQARFFYEMDHLIPSRSDGFARRLLSHVAAYESWGIPAVARPAGWTVFFKGGWRGTERSQLVHQVARLERPGQTVAIAVMTDGDPDMAYGIATIQGVTARLLGVKAPDMATAGENGQ